MEIQKRILVITGSDEEFSSFENILSLTKDFKSHKAVQVQGHNLELDSRIRNFDSRDLKAITGIIFYVHNMKIFESMNPLWAIKQALKEFKCEHIPVIVVVCSCNTLSPFDAVELCWNFIQQYPDDGFIVDTSKPENVIARLVEVTLKRAEKELVHQA